MAKTKVKKIKKFGLGKNQHCPHCGKKVSETRQLLPTGTGYLVEHLWNSSACAYIPFPCSIDAAELLKKNSIVDVIRNGN